MSPTPSKPSNPTEDPFDHLLTLEDTLYTTAYADGVRDGTRAGRTEGRIFGLEKGFEKFAALGSLHGRAVVWAAQLQQSELPQPQSRSHDRNNDPKKGEDRDQKEERDMQEKETSESSGVAVTPFPRLTPTPRLQSNVATLHALSDPATFSTRNEEDAVADYDDRVKRAGAKMKVVQRMVDASVSAAGRRGGDAGGEAGKGRGDGSMEDFSGSRFLR